MATAGSLPSSPAHPTFMVVAGRLKGLLADRMGRTKEILERSTGEVSSVLADVEREMATLESLATKESKLGKPVYLGASKLAGTIKGIMEEVHKCLQQCSVKMLFSVGRPEEVKDELGETRVALQAAQEEAASLRGASAVKDEENARLRTQLGALESAKADAEAIAKRLQEEGLPAALAVVASTRRRIGELESEAAIDHDKISALTKQVEAQGADTLVLSSALQAAQAGASSLLDKLHLAREVLKANRPDIANVLDMLFAKEREVVATSREFATTAVELDSTRRELTSAKADIESKISALRDREVAVAKLSRDLEASISESASLTKDLAEARSMNSARAEEIQQVQAKLAALRSELDETTRRLAETQHDNSELQTSLASKITEAADLGEKVRGGESALDKSQAGVRALNAKVVALESDAKGLRDGIGTLEAKLTTSQSALRAFEARSHELETQLTSRTEDAARLSSQLDAEKTALAAIQAKVAEQVMGLGDAKVKITSLEARLKIQTEASTAAAEKARAEITSLSERLEAAEERDFD